MADLSVTAARKLSVPLQSGARHPRGRIADPVASRDRRQRSEVGGAGESGKSHRECSSMTLLPIHVFAAGLGLVSGAAGFSVSHVWCSRTVGERGRSSRDTVRSASGRASTCKALVANVLGAVDCSLILFSGPARARGQDHPGQTDLSGHRWPPRMTRQFSSTSVKCVRRACPNRHSPAPP